jgi:integrase
MALQRGAHWKREFDLARGVLHADEPRLRDVFADTVRQVKWIESRYRDREHREAQLDLLFESIMAPELRRLGLSDVSEIEEGQVRPEVEAAIDAIKAARSGATEVPAQYRTPFSEIAESFLTDRQREQENKLTEQTKGQFEAVFRLFRDHTDDAPLALLDRRTVASFLDKAKRLNRNWGRSPRTKERSLSELLTLAGKVNGPKITGRTLNRYVSALNQVWAWAAARGEVTAPNPLSGFRERQRSRRDANMPWPDPAITDYFAANPDQSKPDRPDPFYWLPRIALLSGMRLNEICSLEAHDIKEAEGVTYFDIPKGKTESSVRVVPVHTQLAAFLRVAPTRAFLFPDLTPGGPDKKRSWNIGKRLGARFRDIEGTSTFHGLRKNVVQTFERTRVPETEAAQIVGHRKKGITYSVYSPNGLTIQQKHELIERLSLPQGALSAVGEPALKHVAAIADVATGEPGR